ncbi:hypothetical protein NEMBOFW57_006207 [Staphylotrichum longicolle]|uniref:Uncharacterized protein n=1 Tax=Staphylotrichum longicolle TaxID=669026 RepID=A0AAD4I119_9PEZI|nr:hypothetical protein NEMBOFW57_006207 [Staphylotrichum longicolle]
MFRHSDITEAELPFSTFQLIPEEAAIGGVFRTNCPEGQASPELLKYLKQRAVEVSCKTIDVAHGAFRWEDDEMKDLYATLIVFDLQFDAITSKRRIAEATVTFTFTQAKDGQPINIYGLSPYGNLSVLPTWAVEMTAQNLLLRLGISANPTTALASFRQHRVLTQFLSGFSKVIGRESDNQAAWTLLENDLAEEGVPVSMRVAILLGRDSLDPFLCSVGLQASYDAKTALGPVFSRARHNRPYLFNPRQKSTHRLKRFNEDNLGNEDLSMLCDITPINEWKTSENAGHTGEKGSGTTEAE